MQSHDRDRPAATLRIAMFAGMAELVGGRSISVAWPGGSVADMRRLIAELHPELVPLLVRSAVAVDGRYAADDDLVAAAADVALIPPVSGG